MIEAGEIHVHRSQAELDHGELLVKDPRTLAGRRTVSIPSALLPEVKRHVQWLAEKGPDGADKIAYSTTLESVSSARTGIELTFDPDAVRRAEADADHDLTVDGPNLAAQAIAAGLVDEYHLFTTTSVVGGGTRFFPDGVRLDLKLVEQRAFDSGLIYAHYRTR
ncbi:dihydrofolate reductase family protein [Pseudonocardia sp. KRD291]|uniref:dihydrofolate reductase family protein n=1 Tax=Pseudonocardia sp. KRD291 TaxID=2792007 RepID=UPI0027E31AEE|nr:dihydrofolate reductase family protein [Pseudonocardia sp. KRD291]